MLSSDFLMIGSTHETIGWNKDLQDDVYSCLVQDYNVSKLTQKHYIRHQNTLIWYNY